MRFKTGVCSISFRNRSVQEISTAVKKTPLEYIEWGSDVHLPVGKSIMSDIPMSSYGTYFKLGTNPIPELSAYINTAKAHGTNLLRLWCGGVGSSETPDKKALFKECRKAAELAEAEGVMLCMECHMNTFTDTPESARELMEEVSSPAFRMYWQPNQYRSVEENIYSAKTLSSWVENVHVFNWEGEIHLPLGEAQDVWKRYLECFEKGVLLLEFMPDNRLETLPVEAESLMRILEDLK